MGFVVGVPTLPDTLHATRAHGAVCFTGRLPNPWIVKEFSPIRYIPNGVRLMAHGGERADLPSSVLQRYLDRIVSGQLSLGPLQTYPLDEIRPAHPRQVVAVCSEPRHTWPWHSQGDLLPLLYDGSMLGQFVTHDSVRGMVAQAGQSRRPWLLLDRHEFRTAYNQRPFLVRHRLAEHPYFEYGRLAALCRRLPIDQVRYRFGVIPSDAEFDTSLHRFRQGLTLDDAIDRMEERQAYIAIYNPEKDPEYRPVIEGLLGELAAHSEAIDPRLNWYSTYIFITAKDSVTPYHMDREMNFLLQIRGTKTVKLWDPHDDEIMTPGEKDRLLTDRSQPLPTYKPSFEHKAMIFDLVPGNGVHHPFLAPHLVTTGRQLSISLAITFRTHRSDVWTDAHCFNYRLRQRTKLALGAVGQFGVVDATKAGFIRLTRKARRLFRTSRTPPEP